jgi:hypothetical protein
VPFNGVDDTGENECLSGNGRGRSLFFTDVFTLITSAQPRPLILPQRFSFENIRYLIAFFFLQLSDCIC